MFTPLLQTANTIISGKEEQIKLAIACILSKGHLLIEDLPGMGKTTLAHLLAKLFGLNYSRIQFTSDMLPADIIGVSIFNKNTAEFNFHPGPVFSQLVLADEINRATAKTQSALLEAMEEQQITMDGETYPLESPFFVIATQNPIEFHGTYPLPEAQLDRFAMRLSLGYVKAEEEVTILNMQQQNIEIITASVMREDIQQLREAAQAISISDELKRHIVDLVRATRTTPGVQMGASPRAALTLMKAAQVLALFDDLPMVTPAHIRDELAIPVIAHRLKLDSQARFGGSDSEKVVKEILKRIDSPI